MVSRISYAHAKNTSKYITLFFLEPHRKISLWNRVFISIFDKHNHVYIVR
jgi:hypothetical protein